MANYSHGPVSAAVVFAFAWTCLAVINNICLKRRPGWSYAELTTFCWVRVAAFACEAAAAKHPDRLRNALFEGLYDGGFFLVLVVLYGVFKKWLEEAHNHTFLPFSNLSESTKGRLEWAYTFVCWGMPIFSALGIGAAATSLSGHSNDHDGGASDALHDTSGAGFLGVLAIYLAAVTVVILNVGRSKMAVTSHCVQELGPLVIVALLLMLKVCFQLACSNNTTAWLNAALFYSLSALPELLGVIILTLPGFFLIVSHSGLPSSHAGAVGPTTAHVGGQMTHQQSGGYLSGANTQGYLEQPHQNGQGQNSLWGAHAQGFAEQPYEHPQAETAGTQTGQIQTEWQHPNAQHAQHGLGLPVSNSTQQARPQQGYPQQALPAFQQPFLPSEQQRLRFGAPQLPSERPQLPLQTSPLPSQPSELPIQQGNLPSQPQRTFTSQLRSPANQWVTQQSHPAFFHQQQ